MKVKFTIKATGSWKYLRVRDNFAKNDKAFNGNATDAKRVDVSTEGGSSGSISVWARSADGSTDERFVERRPVREDDPVEIAYTPPS
jgi:hypothetical protein